MYALFFPSPPRLERMFAEAAHLPLSTPEDPLAGADRAGWNVDHYEIRVAIPAGAQPARVRIAAAGIVHELAFLPRWMRAVRRGNTVVVAARAVGLYGVFCDRILSERAESDDARGSFAVGFTYATLAGHFETGIETFLASREAASAPVTFTIDAVSRADGLLKKAISLAVVRRLQRRFGLDATARFAELLGRALGER